jgi:hypothetical protein
MNSEPIDVARLIRVGTLLFAILAGSLVYATYEPTANTIQARLDAAQFTLRSEDLVFAETPRVRAELTTLARRFDPILGRRAQAVFLRELASTVKRRELVLVSTTEPENGSSVTTRRPSFSVPFHQARVTVELRGTYRHLLAAFGDLTQGSGVVSIGVLTLRRGEGAIVATIPVTIYEPIRRNAP